MNTLINNFLIKRKKSILLIVLLSLAVSLITFLLIITFPQDLANRPLNEVDNLRVYILSLGIIHCLFLIPVVLYFIVGISKEKHHKFITYALIFIALLVTSVWFYTILKGCYGIFWRYSHT
jgi:peptidoglycan/LPS O-acetylase OafA/YrhL